MKLYYAKGACSLSADLIYREAGIELETIRVDLKTHTTENGDDYYKINLKGYVPALQIDSGEVITEAGVVLSYLADQKPDSHLIPPAGTIERYRAEEWLVFIATELHKNFGPYHNPHSTQEEKDAALKKLHKRFAYVNTELEGKKYLLGDEYSVCDAYCFAILRWCPQFNIDLSEYKNVEEYVARIEARPYTKEALAFEGI